MNLFKINDRKDTPSFSKKINPQQDNQINSHNENHANSKPEVSDKREKDVANPPQIVQAVQGAKK